MNEQPDGSGGNLNLSSEAEQEAGGSASLSEPSRVEAALACLTAAARMAGVPADLEALLRAFPSRNTDELVLILLRAAKKIGLKAKKIETSVERLCRLPSPSLLLFPDGEVLILLRVETATPDNGNGEAPQTGRAMLFHPREKRPFVWSFEQLSERWRGDAIVPPGVSAYSNVMRALEYQATHTAQDTLMWFYELVKNNSKNHLPSDTSDPNHSMDYKQLDSMYADFGNFNYAVVGRALGISDRILKIGAGFAQGKANGRSEEMAVLLMLIDLQNHGDNAEDQVLIQKGIDLARLHGHKDEKMGVSDILVYLRNKYSVVDTEYTREQFRKIFDIYRIMSDKFPPR